MRTLGLILTVLAATAVAESPVAAASAVAIDAGTPAALGISASPSLNLRADAPTSLDLMHSEEDLANGEELSLGWTLFRTTLVLGIVVALAYLTLNVGLRRLLGIKPAVGGGAGLVSVLERIPLDQKRALFLVRAANEVLLIGGSENSLELIAKLDPAEVAKLNAAPAKVTQLSPFLLKLLGRKDAPAVPPSPPADPRTPQ